MKTNCGAVAEYLRTHSGATFVEITEACSKPDGLRPAVKNISHSLWKLVQSGQARAVLKTGETTTRYYV